MQNEPDMFPIIQTFNSVKKARLFSIMFLCALLAILVVLSLVVLITWITGYMVNFEKEWIDSLFTWIIGIVTGIGGWFMLPALTILIGGMFQERVIDRIEKAYYPESIRTETPKFWPDFWHDIKFTVWALFLNLLILPFYFFAIGFIISIILNSYLLGCEFFDSAAGYHLGKNEASELGKRNIRIVYIGGLAITLMTLIPILNLFVPIIAVVWMVHVYHGIRKKTG